MENSRQVQVKKIGVGLGLCFLDQDSKHCKLKHTISNKQVWEQLLASREGRYFSCYLSIAGKCLHAYMFPLGSLTLD